MTPADYHYLLIHIRDDMQIVIDIVMCLALIAVMISNFLMRK